MFAASALFKSYAAGLSREFEVYVDVAGVVYDNTKVIEFDIEDGCVTGDEFTIGTVVNGTLSLTLATSDTIAANAKVKPFVRLNGISGYSEWVPLGVFYIDSRSKGDGVFNFKCCDKLIFAEQEYISTLTFPATMTDVFSEILTQLNLTADASVAIDPLYMIPYKPDGLFNLREMMGFIASANCASVRLTRGEKVRFISFATASPTAITASDYIACKQLNPVKSYTRIVLTYNTDWEILEAGTGDADHTLNLYNPFIDEAMLAALLVDVSSITYAPVDMSWKGMSHLEAGDPIQITLRDSTVLNTFILSDKSSYKGGLISATKAPSISSQQSEFVFEGSLTRAVRNAVKTTESYYGVTIGRTNGIKIVNEANNSEATINSDKWEVIVNGVNKLYADYQTNEMYFGGRLTVEALEAVKAEIDVVVSNTVIVNNLYAQYGRIANLTVNELNTSYKMIMNYLLKDTDFEASIADVVYRGIYDDRNEIWVCTTDGTEDEQVLGADDAPLYWIDATKTQIHTDVTAYPVMRWVYDYVLKYEQGTELNNGVYLPYTIEGAGDGSTLMSGKIKMSKVEDGYYMTYFKRVTGEAVTFGLTDNGIVGVIGGGDNPYQECLNISGEEDNDIQLPADCPPVVFVYADDAFTPIIILPSSTNTRGREITIIRTGRYYYAITYIHPMDGDDISGFTNVALYNGYQSLTFISTGYRWELKGYYRPMDV